MSNATPYDVTIIGPKSKLYEPKGFLLSGIEEHRGCDYGDLILHIDRLFSDVDGEREHTWITIYDFRQRGEPINGPMLDSVETGMHQLFFEGVSLCTLPFGLMRRLSAKFPELEFRFGGTADHEVSADWVAKNGNVTRVNLGFQFVQMALVVDFFRDGKMLDVPDFRDTSYDCDYGNTEGPHPIIPDNLVEFCTGIYRDYLNCECPGIKSGQLRTLVRELVKSRAKRFESQPAIDLDEEPSVQVRQLAEEIAVCEKGRGAESPPVADEEFTTDEEGKSQGVKQVMNDAVSESPEHDYVIIPRATPEAPLMIFLDANHGYQVSVPAQYLAKWVDLPEGDYDSRVEENGKAWFFADKEDQVDALYSCFKHEGILSINVDVGNECFTRRRTAVDAAKLKAFLVANGYK